MASILLTGASGLVGSRLLPRLADADFDVRALVRREIDLPAKTTALRGDLNDPESLPQTLEGVEAILHFAALFRTDDEDAIWKANLDGTRNLIAAAEAHAPDARFIMASTGNVYNPDSPRPSRESDSCTPSAAYPASKLAAEGLLRESALTWSILHLPFVYVRRRRTPRDDPDARGTLRPAPRPHLLRGPPPRHHDRGRIAPNGAMDHQIVNITDDGPVTVYEMAELVGNPLEGSAEPLANPWSGRMDPSLLTSDAAVINPCPSLPPAPPPAVTG